MTFVVPGRGLDPRAGSQHRHALGDATGAFEAHVIIQPPRVVPTYPATPGRPEHGIPDTLPSWRALTSFDVHTSYTTELTDDNGTVTHLQHPLGSAHLSVYASHDGG